VIQALIGAEALEFFGPGSAFVTWLTAGSVVAIVLLLLVRARTKRTGLRDLFGITATLLVLVLAALAMIIVEYQLG
jgi:glucan phosphoethanolaminetransferase (alkaline phosphatase superfamily)